VAALVAAAALTGLLLIAVALPQDPDEISAIILFTFGNHGVHLSDLPAAACWLAGMAACWSLWRR
jgi:hypothetical protein